MTDHKTDTDTNTTCKGHCPKCGADRVADIAGSKTYEENWVEDEFGPMWVTETYRILQCRGCERLYVQRELWFSEDGAEYDIDPVTGKERQVYKPRVTYWPLPEKRKKPDWMHQFDDGMLRGLLDEVYGALDADHRVLAAIGIRTVLDQTMVSEGANPASSFAEKLKELKKKGIIGESEKTFEQLIAAGSAAAHRNWKPTPDQLSTLFDGMENYLHRVLVLKNTVDEIKVPSKPERPKKGKISPGS